MQLWTILVLVLVVRPNDASELFESKSNPQQQQQQSFSTVCQSGIREDNTNYIYCARRGLYQVPLFSKNNVVYDELVLSDNRIGELSKTSFNRIKVKKIFLNGNPVRSVEDNTFYKLENHLEELWLDAESSAIGAGLPVAIMNHLRNLNRLRLKGFNVNRLADGAFKRLNRLEILSLQYCSIQTVDRLAFDGLANSLKELYLDGNALTYIPTEALIQAQFKSLRVLSLAQNGIKSIGADSFGPVPSFYYEEPAAHSALTGLVRLDLSYNGLKSIHADAFDFFNVTLDTLALQNNEINAYNLKFAQKLRNLRELNLDFNLLGKLATDDEVSLFKNCAHLQYLSLQGNSIHFDDDDEGTFAGLSTLVKLNLARNSIKSIPDGLFKPMTGLKNLILDKNGLDGLTEFTFAGLENSLMNLSLQYTKLKSNSLESLRPFRTLERVKLAYNELETIDWTLFANTRLHSTLTNLDLQHNRINRVGLRNVPPTVKMDNLTELDLSNNQLCSFSSFLLDRMPKLKTLALAQNPLVCDCHILDLYRWTKAKYDKDVINYIQWQCQLPGIDSDNTEYSRLGTNMEYSMKMRIFTSLTEGDFKCADNYTSKCTTFDEPRPTTVSTSTSTKGSTAVLVDSSAEFPAHQQASARLTRISSIQLRSDLNSVVVTWELDSQLADDSLSGFKITYAIAATNTTTRTKDLAFLVDKTQHSFRIENLSFSTRYTVCVSIVRSQGYDKYCRDVDTGADPIESSRLKAQRPSPQVAIAAAPSSAVVSYFDSSVLSGLMITILTILIVCILSLVVFLFVYVRRCRLADKKYAAAATTANSLRKNYTGAVLTSTIEHRAPTLDGDKCFCSTLHNQRYLNCVLQTTNATHSGLKLPCNCVNLSGGNGTCCGSSTLTKTGLTVGDSSTVSSSVSEPSNGGNVMHVNEFDMMSIPSPREATNWRYTATAKPHVNKAVVIATNQSDMALSTPTSFTHFILPPPGSAAPSVPDQPYMAYELYNCFQSLIPTNIHQLNSIKQQSGRFAAAPQQFLIHANTNNTTNNSNTNDHVYCEIPSTISRSYRCNDAAQLLVNNTNTFKNSHFAHNQQIQQHQPNNHCPNSSTSLLLSSSSSSTSTSTSTSPQSNTTQQTKYTTASII